MANIFEAVKELELDKSKTKSKVIVLTKDKKQLSLEASSSKSSEIYRLISIDVTKVPSLSAGQDEGELVIDLNVNKLRKTKSGFVPKLLVISGLDTLKKHKRNGDLFCNAWVGQKVLNKMSIQADHEISSNELSSKIRDLISKTYSKKPSNTTPYSDSTYAYVNEIYPFENYCIFTIKDDKYRQRYKLDPVLREIALDGKPTKVFEQYVDVSDSKGVKGLEAGSLSESLYDRPNNGSGALGAIDGPFPDDNWNNADMLVHYGARGSEANNPMFRLMLNVEEALNMYQHETAEGVHKVIYSPYAAMPAGLINAGREAKIAASLTSINLESFSVADFLQWQNKKMSLKASAKTKNGLTASDHVYIGDLDDPSTWHLACNTLENIDASLNLLVKGKVQIPVKSLLTAKLKLKKIKADMIQPMPSVTTSPGNGGMSSKGGPHLGKGKSAAKHLKEIETKLKTRS